MDVVEGHPIPQDITGFQFKLIGDMTVKQFAYLAAGLVLGWLIIVIPGPLLIKIPIAAVPTLTGLFFAFVPVQGRPADTMFFLFVQSIFRPNEYVFHKPKNLIREETTFVKNAGPTKPQPGSTYGPHITKVTSIEDVSSPTPQAKSVQNLTTPQAQKQEQQASQTVTNLSTQLEEAKKAEQTTSPQDNDVHRRALLLEEKLQQAMLEKEALQKQLASLQQGQISQPQQPQEQRAIQPTAARVKKIPDSVKKSIGVPFAPDVPNLVTGVIKDPRGNVLPGILVEIKDKDDNPVRAFKTNALGQFASATPLLNGTYTMAFEDPKKEQQFDALEISIDGNILTPLEITSVDEREELRKSLFTN